MKSTIVSEPDTSNTTGHTRKSPTELNGITYGGNWYVLVVSVCRIGTLHGNGPKY